MFVQFSVYREFDDDDDDDDDHYHHPSNISGGGGGVRHKGFDHSGTFICLFLFTFSFIIKLFTNLR